MKPYKIIVLLFVIPILLSAKDPFEKYNIICGKKKVLSNSINGYPEVFGHDSTSFFVHRPEYVNYIEIWDNDMNLTKESEYLKIDVKLKDRHFEKVVYFKDSIYMFYSEKKINRTLLYVKTIDKYTLEQHNNERLIVDVPHFKGNYPFFNFEYSLLHNKLLLVVETDAALQKSIKFDFYVFDKGLEVDWSKTDFFQYSYSMPREKQFVVDELGNIHILALIYEIRFLNHLIGDDELKNQYLIVSYLEDGEKVIKNQIALTDRFIRSIKIIATDDGSFICSGLYSLLYKFGVKGAFFATNKTPTKDLAPILYSEFADEIVENLPDDNKSERTEEIYSYKVKDLFYRKNGDVVLCAEQEYNQGYNNTNDIILVSFDEYGRIKWNKTIPKVQSGNEGYVSFTTVAPVSENGFKILYNENANNTLDLNQEKFKSFHYNSASYLVSVHVDEFGNIEKEKITSREKRELIPLIMNTYDMRDGNIIMYSNRYRKYRYCKLSFFK